MPGRFVILQRLVEDVFIDVAKRSDLDIRQFAVGLNAVAATSAQSYTGDPNCIARTRH